MTLKDDIKERLTKQRPVRVFSYIHGEGRIGAMIELESDTDFGLRTDEVEAVAHDILLQVASMAPRQLSTAPHLFPIYDVRARVMDEFAAEVLGTGKPPQIATKIVDGKMKKWDKENVLLCMPWVKDNKVTIQGLLDEVSGQLGETLTITRFARFGR